MTLGHAAAIFVDQFGERDAGRRQLDARIPDPAGDGIAAQPLAAVAAVAREPFRALLDDDRNPVQSLDIVDQGRPAENAVLRNIGRAVPRQATLAFDRFDHRRFFAADIGAGAAPQMDFGVRRQLGGFERRDLGQQDLPVLGIFVAQIEIDCFRLDRPGRDQHALEHPVRFGVQIVAVLERAGLAFVGIDRHQARARFGTHESPLLPGREPGAAQAAQPGVAEDLDDFLRRSPAVQTILKQPIAALLPISR